MDKVMSDINAQVQVALEKTAARMEQCSIHMKKYTTGEYALKLDAEYQNLKYRAQRLAICSDILTGRAYTVVEKDKELFVQKGGDAKLISLAQKFGLNAEFIQGKAELP